MNVRASLRRRLRHWLVWLLVVALPWPALAAARMADCCPVDGATSHAAVTAPRPSLAHASHDTMTMDDDASPAGDGHQPAHAHPHDGRCGACAACSAGAMLTGQPLRVPANDRTDVRPAIAASRVVAAFGDGPERPPPSFLA